MPQSGPSEAFSAAAQYLSNAPSLKKLSTTVKLEIYGLFKYVTVSPKPDTSRPSFFDMTGKAKWDAWDEAGKRYQSTAEAEARYLEIAKSLGWSEGMEIQGASQKDSMDDDDEHSSGPPSGMGPSVSAMLPPELIHDDSIHGLALAGRTDALRTLLDTHKDLDINALDEYGYAPLHLACDRGNLHAVQLLVEKGANVTTKDSDDLTPSEVAKIAGHDDIVKYLELARG